MVSNHKSAQVGGRFRKRQLLLIKVGRGVSRSLTFADQGGRGGLTPSFSEFSLKLFCHSFVLVIIQNIF